MQMMNRLMSDALDSKKFVDQMKAFEAQAQREDLSTHQQTGETRTQRRARERAEAKAARKVKA